SAAPRHHTWRKVAEHENCLANPMDLMRTGSTPVLRCPLKPCGLLLSGFAKSAKLKPHLSFRQRRPARAFETALPGASHGHVRSATAADCPRPVADFAALVRPGRATLQPHEKWGDRCPGSVQPFASRPFALELCWPQP